MHLERSAVGSCSMERRVHRAAGVDHDHVAGFEDFGKIAEDAMLDVMVGVVRHQQSHLVAGQPSGLGRRVGFQLRRQVEVEGVEVRNLSRIEDR